MEMSVRQAVNEDGSHIHSGDFQKWLLANALSMNSFQPPEDPSTMALVSFLEGWKSCLIHLADVLKERTGEEIDLTE